VAEKVKRCTTGKGPRRAPQELIGRLRQRLV
jgi:hypothetical protein